ncbi:MAG: hypothetical protein IH784_06650 [Bacteroidetes bacterium]|nr:hypothetical protein [Bacteroidota bacterium]
MGQQQLLLIVLGVIVVGIAVVVGINLFNASAEEANKDGIVSDCTNLGAMAQQYYKKPASMGGGANSFVGWVIATGLDSTANGTYVASGLSLTNATITGTPFSGTSYSWTVTTTVSGSTITTVIN